MGHLIRRVSFDIRTISSMQELERVTPAWRRLASSGGYAMNDPTWYIHAARATHAAGAALHAICAWDSDELAAIAPLIYSSEDKRYEIIGSRVLYEPSELPVRDAPAAQALAQAVASLKRPVFLSRLPETDLFGAAFEGASRAAGLTLEPRSSGSPYIDLSIGWDAYYAALPSRIRNILRRAERALAKLGRVELEFRRPNATETPALLQQVFEIEMRSWKGRARSAVLQRPDLRSFFFGYGPAAAGEGALLIALLRFQGTPVAGHVANIQRGAYRQLKIAYDESHSKHLPGLALLLHTIRWSFDQGLETYEFMGTEEPWIQEWTQSVRRSKSVLFYPYTPLGMTGLARDSLARVGRRLRRSAAGARAKE